METTTTAVIVVEMVEEPTRNHTVIHMADLIAPIMLAEPAGILLAATL